MSTTAAVSVVPGQRVPSRGIKLTWEQPPPVDRTQGSSLYEAIASELRKRPGQWAVIKEVPRTHAKRGWSLSSRINQSRGSVWGAGGFESCARSIGDVVKVYARYTGPAAVSAVPETSGASA